MESFVFNPEIGTESIDAFNSRVGTFCAENPVVLVTPSAIGGTLVLSLTEAADVDLPVNEGEEHDCLSATVLYIPATDLPKLETVLDAENKRLKALDTDESVCIPTAVTLHPAPNGAFAVFQYRAGIVEAGAS